MFEMARIYTESEVLSAWDNLPSGTESDSESESELNSESSESSDDSSDESGESSDSDSNPVDKTSWKWKAISILAVHCMCTVLIEAILQVLTRVQSPLPPFQGVRGPTNSLSSEATPLDAFNLFFSITVGVPGKGNQQVRRGVPYQQ